MTVTLADSLQLFGAILAVVLTLMVLLYVFGDNPVFRLALHIFIGVAAGYAGGVAWHAIVRPYLIDPLLAWGTSEFNFAQVAVRLLLVALLLTKLSPRTAVIGNPVTALLVGVGAATAVGGAIQGTIFPLVSGSSVFFQTDAIRAALQSNVAGGFVEVFRRVVFEGGVVLVGTIATLVYFHFTARARSDPSEGRGRFIELTAWVGQLFIAVTFGALFAGVYLAALNALIDRLFFVWDFVSALIFG